ncbi:MAG TPA: lipopolysaccharide heptosyltransferase II [Tepidisphaeraceae bacterium]|nr:lipopolysaccharide heptosyltransferase II [Tepidisphaeraceae bacterium]
MTADSSLRQIQPRRILLIKPSAIGDVVHTLPVLNLIRRRWPDAHIAWMLTPLCANLLEGHPQLNEIILFQRRQLGRGWRDPRATAGLWKLAAELRNRKFDLVIDLQGLFRSGWFTWTTGAPYRVGFAEARECAWIFYTHRIRTGDKHNRLRNGGQHAVDRYLTLADALGCGRSPVEFPLSINQTERSWVSEKLGGISKYAVLIPGTIWQTKRWPVEHFADLANTIRRRFNLAIVAAGSPEERELANQVNADLNLAGQTNLRQLTALINGAQIIIANDTGPMHIAAALGKPLVTPFGPTNPDLTGPYNRPDAVVRLDIPCSPCYSRQCSHTSCMHLLKANMVADQVEDQLNRFALPIAPATIAGQTKGS